MAHSSTVGGSDNSILDFDIGHPLRTATSQVRRAPRMTSWQCITFELAECTTLVLVLKRLEILTYNWWELYLGGCS